MSARLSWVVGVGAFLSSVVLGGCGKERPDKTEPAGDVSYVVKLTRDPGYEFCRAYSVELRADGTVEYTGRACVRERGPKVGHVDPGAVAALAKRIEDAGFMTMTWKEPCDLFSNGDPTVTTTLVRGDRKRTIRNYHGNLCMPPALRDLESEIDRVAGTAAWTKCPGDSCQR